MTGKHEDLMEALANQDFVFVEETDAVVYEKQTREGSETVSMIKLNGLVIHERFNKNGMQVFSKQYDLEIFGSTARLLNATR